MTVDYLAVVNDAYAQLEEIERKLASLQQDRQRLTLLIKATTPFLTDEQKKRVVRSILNIEDTPIQFQGLTDAIRSALKRNANHWMTSTTVKEMLANSGFDFSSYESNPLASVSTVLRRIAGKDGIEVLFDVDRDVTVYRMKRDTGVLARAAQRAKDKK